MNSPVSFIVMSLLHLEHFILFFYHRYVFMNSIISSMNIIVYIILSCSSVVSIVSKSIRFGFGVWVICVVVFSVRFIFVLCGILRVRVLVVCLFRLVFRICVCILFRRSIFLLGLFLVSFLDSL